MLQCRFGRLWMSLAAAPSIQTLPVSISSRSTSSPNRRHSPQCGQSQLWKTEVSINSPYSLSWSIWPSPFHLVSYSGMSVIHQHSSWSVIPICLLFISWCNPGHCSLSNICQLIGHVFVPVLSSLFVISWHDPVQSSLSDICQLIWPSPFQSVCYCSTSVIHHLILHNTQSIPDCLLFKNVCYSSTCTYKYMDINCWI